MMKGQMDTAATWIFGLIAGLVIFALLITFGLKQVQQEEYVTNTAVLENLELQFRTIARTSNTFSELKTPNINLNLICPDSDPDSSVMILEGGTTAKPTIFQAIFSPGNLKGTKIYSWSKDWKIHTKVDSFLYLTDENTMYVFVRDEGENDLLDRMLEEFPAEISASIEMSELIGGDSDGRYAVQGYDKYRFVLFDYSQNVNANIPRPPLRGDVSLINIDTNNKIVRFYDATSGNFDQLGEPVEYNDDSLLRGAIFSQDPGYYRCNVQKALNRLNIWAELNMERIHNLTETLDPDDKCSAEPLPNDCPECVSLMEDLPGIYSSLIGVTSISGLGDEARKLADISTDLAKGRSCPTL